MSRNDKREASERLMESIKDIRDKYILEADETESDIDKTPKASGKRGWQPWSEIMIGAAAVLILGVLIWSVLQNREKKAAEDTADSEISTINETGETAAATAATADETAVTAAERSTALPDTSTEKGTGEYVEVTTEGTTRVERTTGYESGEIQRQYLYLGGKLYVYADQRITLPNDISSAGQGAEEIGEVKKVNNISVPDEDFEASHIPLGAKIYRWNGDIYVTTDGISLEKYMEDIWFGVDTVVPGTFIAAKQGYYFWPLYPVYSDYQGIYELRIYDYTEKDVLAKYKTGDMVKVGMTTINDLNPPIMRFKVVVKDNSTESKINIDGIREECEKLGLTLIE